VVKKIDYARGHVNIGIHQILRSAAFKKRIEFTIRVFEMWGLRQLIREFSYIGKSVIEIYFDKADQVKVSEALQAHGLDLILDLDVCGNQHKKKALPDCIDAIVNRLGFLVSRNLRRPSLIEAILKGHGKRTHELVMIRAKEIQERFHQNQSKVFSTPSADSNDNSGENDKSCH
jgi:hypothetical protein